MKNLLFTVALATIFLSIFSCSKQDDVLNEEILELDQNNFDLRVESFAKSLSYALTDSKVRSELKTVALEKFDGDYDILIGKYFESSQGKYLKNKMNEQGWDDLSIVDDFPLLQIAIPRLIHEWDEDTLVPTVAYHEKNFSQNTKTIGGFDSNQKSIKVDAITEPTVPVIIVSINERLYSLKDRELMIENNLLNSDLKRSSEAYWKDYYLVDYPSMELNRGSGSVGNCTYTTNCGYAYNTPNIDLMGFKVPNLPAIEHWTAGAPEIRINVMSPKNSGSNIYSQMFEPLDRSDINTRQWWCAGPQYMFKWNRSYDGDYITVNIVEEDGGVFSSETQLISATVNGQTYSVSCPKFLKDNYYDCGTVRLHYQDCDWTTYGGTILFKVDAR